jgi:hypothetical protein
MFRRNSFVEKIASSRRLTWRPFVAAAAAMVATSAVVLVAPAVAGAAPAAPHAAPAVQATPAISEGGNAVVGDLYCGTGSVSPATGVVGGTKLTVSVKWQGSPTNKNCLMPITNCGSTYFGDCYAGYWLIGVFCNPLAAINLAKGQQYCDMNNIVVLTDNNAGPNNPTDSHGTSYNQCSTVKTLGSIFGGLPGTLYCVADGSTGDGWTDSWKLGATTGGAFGPAEQTGSKVPFKPSGAGVDCPPSAANIKAGALPNYCAFTVMPVAFDYYCFFGCVPNPSDPNDGATELTVDHLGILFQYAQPKKGKKISTR